MFSKLHRFHGHTSVNAMYKRGVAVRDNALSLRVAPRERPGYRVAIVVSKKVSKSAVVRNRIRRRLYEQLRQHDLQGYDVVASVFADQVATMDAAELADLVTKLVVKAIT
jgi:ribonuclease P protein component